jgi:glycogen(starch) synthase
MMHTRQILLPSDVFPPRCGGAGWSAHALALALQTRGEQVTALVPTLSDSALFAGSATMADVLGVPTVRTPTANYPWRVWRQSTMVAQLNHALRQLTTLAPSTIIHAQHILSAQAAIPLQNRRTKVIITVRDHWPWDMRATGMQMAGDQRTWQGLKATMQQRALPLRQQLFIPAYLLQMRARARLLSDAAAVIAVSQHMAKRITQHVPTANVVAIPNMVDVADIQQRIVNPPSVSIPERFALFVGKLEANKGAQLLPELIQHVRPPALVVAGDGPLSAQIQQAAAQVNVPCVMLNWVDHDDVLRLMARCEALWFPSSWDEPLSRVLLEALACGAPIVAMPTGGTPEIIVDGVSGILAPDVSEFVTCARQLHADSLLRKQLTHGAITHAQKTFAVPIVVTKVQQLYDQIVGVA